jgi:DNA-directed RNA polymerase specialized sigma24 family protein
MSSSSWPTTAAAFFTLTSPNSPARHGRGFLARATAGAHDVDDLVHATFLAAAESAGRYDGRVSCRPWLIGIAAQLVRRRRQASGRFFTFLSSFGGM